MHTGIAFAGAGRVAELHARAMREVDGARLVGVFDTDQPLSRRRAADWDCRSYASLADALADDQVDAVFVLGPAATHESTTIQCLDASRHVLVEKPVAAPDGIRRMLAAADAAGCVCMPGHTYAYQPEFTRLRRLVHAGHLGSVRAAWIHYAIKHPEEVAAAYGGVLEELMIHHAYLTLALFGRPDRIFASRARTGWRELTQDDQAWMAWEWDHGLNVHLFATFAVDDPTSDSWTFMVKALGTQGGGTYRWRDAVFERALGTLSFAIPAYEEAFIHQTAAFVRAVRGRRDAIVSPLEDAELVGRLLALADRADRSRSAVATGTAHLLDGGCSSPAPASTDR